MPEGFIDETGHLLTLSGDSALRRIDTINLSCVGTQELGAFSGRQIETPMSSDLFILLRGKEHSVPSQAGNGFWGRPLSLAAGPETVGGIAACN